LNAACVSQDVSLAYYVFSFSETKINDTPPRSDDAG
jgi:hypothetical protein